MPQYFDPNKGAIVTIPYDPPFVQTGEPTASYTGQLWYDTDETSSSDFDSRYVLQEDTITTITTATTLDSTYATVLCDATSSAFTVTLPAASTVEGRRFHVKKINTNSNDITVDGDGSETIDGSTTATLTGSAMPSIEIQSNGTAWFIV